ncbi:YczE/YyaS/YitT family protein [Aquibacillus albus]|uniref:Membrane protein YczE n=1 Tax=Aquibacillus albus TaxID=1168171 RepID=A0ABS2MUI7_9BACI|nr:YitT family protein [Aquibacillus albus]MBM7569561.1 putative membrane protein YczE [Aquibacillus albus]
MKVIRKREVIFNWIFFITGLLLLALGLALTIKANHLGISPWEVFHYGLHLQFGLTIGTWSILAGFTIVLMTAAITKSFPRLGTYLNMLFVGVFIDFFNWILPNTSDLWMELILLLLGIVISAIGIGFYVAPNLGAGPRDTVMLNLSKQFGWKVSYVRNGIELVVCLLGWALGGPVGIGTIIIVLSLGTCVGYAIPYAENFLNFFIKRGDKYENINQGTLRINHYD